MTSRSREEIPAARPRWPGPARARALASLASLVCSVLLLGPAALAAPLPRRAAVGLHVLGPSELIIGTRASYRVALHWATGPTTSGPLPFTRVTVSLGSRPRRQLASARSDGSGHLNLSFVVPALPAAEHKLDFVALAPLGSGREQLAVTLVPGGKILLTTDKGLYQPAQTIHVRALAVRSVDSLPLRHQAMVFRVRDPRDTLVFEDTRRTSAYGIAAIDFPLADEINLGRYTVSATVEGDGARAAGERTVKVDRYRLPTFQVRMHPQREVYRPGERLRGTVSVRYHHGKPVRDARVSLEVVSHQCSQISMEWRCRKLTDRLQETTNADGDAEFSVHLPRCRALTPCLDGRLHLIATVTDRAQQQFRQELELPLSQLFLRLSVAVPGQKLVPSLKSALHILVSKLDGRPAHNARVRVQAADQIREARTDALGIATVELIPRATSPCQVPGRRGMEIVVEAEDSLGQTRQLRQCLPLSDQALLVRPRRSLVGPGEPLEVEVLAPGARDGEAAHLDLVKEDQSIAGLVRPFRAGVAHFSIQPDQSLEGLVSLRGYRLLEQTRQVSAVRAAYIEPRASLLIEARLDRKSYRPGTEALLDLRIRDSLTGKGVQAALGLHAVDSALLELAAEQLEDPTLFFALPPFVGAQTGTLRARGESLTSWLGQSRSPLRARAAEVLLSVLVPPHGEVLQSDPWTRREERWEEQAPRLIEVASQAVRELALGARTSSGWRFHPRLIALLVRSGRLPRRDEKDPWQQEITPERLRALDPGFDFVELARDAEAAKLEWLYSAIWQHRRALGLPLRYVPGECNSQGRHFFYLLPDDILSRLKQIGGLPSWAFHDPWGQPYRARRSKRPVIIEAESGGEYYELLAHQLLYSRGPDGVPGTRDDVTPAFREVVRVEGARVQGCGGSGYGTGYGSLSGRSARAPSIVVGKASARGSLPGSIESPGLATARPRVHFPETLFWKPEVITDAAGHARVSIPLADSITTWRVFARASSLDARHGKARLDLPVFQPFFLELDLPGQLTVGDRVSLPVSVHNYLKTPQTVILRLQPASWFEASGARELRLALKPAEVAVRHFPIQARHAGGHTLTVEAAAVAADGNRVEDAVQRAVQVAPDGVEQAFAHGGVLASTVEQTVQIPEKALPGSSRLKLAIYPGPASQALTGLEAMLAEPHGCFEQTSSTLYPNILVLEYLVRVKQLTPAVEKRARRYIATGYQRLLTFEVRGGGFSLFGAAPADPVLTAYGLMEFTDLARVHRIDSALLSRTQKWLVRQQSRDGSFGPAGAAQLRQRLRVTAYLARALHHSGYRGPPLQRALAFVGSHLARVQDPYSLALVAGLLAGQGDQQAARPILDQLWAMRVESAQGISFPGPELSLTQGAGESADIETTALVALAAMKSNYQPTRVPLLLQSLVARKDPRGGWHSTQATVLALRALLEDRSLPRPRGKVSVLVDGKEVAKLPLDGEDRTHQVDLSSAAGHGTHQISLRLLGRGRLHYQLIGRYWLAPEHSPPAAGGALALSTSYDRLRLRTGEELQISVTLQNRGQRRVPLPLLRIGLPPGFDLEQAALERTIAALSVDRLQLLGNQAVFYLRDLEAGQQQRFSLRLRSRMPLTVRPPASTLYEYYQPRNRADSRPLQTLVAH